MTDNNTSQTEETYPEIEYVVREVPRKRSLLERVGCGALVLVWFAVLLLPLFFFVLAIQGDITIRHTGDVPDKLQHPRFQITLIMDADSRGLQFTRSGVNRYSATDLCLDTRVNYTLWQGQGAPARYCDCYTRETADEDWSFTESTQGGCE